MGDGASTRWPTDAKLPKQVPRHVSSLVQCYLPSAYSIYRRWEYDASPSMAFCMQATISFSPSQHNLSIVQRADPCRLHQLLSSDAGPPCKAVAVTSRDAIGCHSRRKLGDRRSTPNGCTVPSIPTCIAASPPPERCIHHLAWRMPRTTLRR